MNKGDNAKHCPRFLIKEFLSFPEGTFNIGRKWTFYGKNIKVTGAGMWYTNIQFTNSNANSGGIAFAGENSCYNVEFCNMYINSNLSSRYNEQASYKCLVMFREMEV